MASSPLYASCIEIQNMLAICYADTTFIWSSKLTLVNDIKLCNYVSVSKYFNESTFYFPDCGKVRVGRSIMSRKKINKICLFACLIKKLIFLRVWCNQTLLWDKGAGAKVFLFYSLYHKYGWRPNYTYRRKGAKDWDGTDPCLTIHSV